MSISFPKTEEEVLQRWKELDAFQRQLQLSEGQPRFTFYDGPPFATGVPHYGHLLASTIKDVVPRYWSMKGHHVVRRFGWDTHGLPIEHEIDKKLGVSGRDAVMKMGIEAYNGECRAIVMRYAAEWRTTIDRLGRWIDFDNDYKTMDPDFMESVWWVFKQLFEKNQVYRSYQVMPYSTALCTPLSNFEAQQNYKDTQDPSIMVSFPLVKTGDSEDHTDASLLIWTTTPWTLPSNLAVCANAEFEYIKILDEKTSKKYVLLESRLVMLYKDPKKAKFQILSRFKGKDLLGWKYEPLFNYFVSQYPDCFRVLNADFVTSEDGTGLVHTSPAFGAEDFDAAMAAGIISPDRLPPNPVDEKGCFTDEVPDYAGQHVKVADKAIIKYLRTTGRLITDTQFTHSAPFCWRSDTPLIRKAVSAWFVKIQDSIPQMLEEVEKSNWVPDFVKGKRFANWLSNAKDWNISRNRYWGTPIPLWTNEDFTEIVCVGSIAELKELSGHEGVIDDIHRDKVDNITIPSKSGKGVLRRIDEVFDCWFESGSMPYASQHYPFEKKETFDKAFPADFIAEGLDQTRGWFYTLTVLGVKVFGKLPFRNCIVNGIILAEDGKKMSKRLKNYPEASKVMNLYGADALRLYLINSPVVRAETLRFKEIGLKETVSRVLLPLWNSYKFFEEQCVLLKSTKGVDFTFDPTLLSSNTNVMDRWILAACQSLLKFVNQEMAAYRLYTVIPRLLNLINDLTNWYIRFNRTRLKGTANTGEKDTHHALNTLFETLFTLVRGLAPFIPFLTDHIYCLLAPRLPATITSQFKDSRSVHFLTFPEVREELLDVDIERSVGRMRAVIELGRVARERRTIGLKVPLARLVVVADPGHLADLRSLESYILLELNVRHLELTSDEAKYDVQLSIMADWSKLGSKLKKDAAKVRKGLPNLTQEQIRKMFTDKYITVEGVRLDKEDVRVIRGIGQDSDPEKKWETNSDNEMLILLDTELRQDLEDEGIARDLVNRVQRLRKKAGLAPTDNIKMAYHVLKNPTGLDLGGILKSQQGLIEKTLKNGVQEEQAPGASEEAKPEEEVIAEEEQVIMETTILLRLLKL